MRWLFRAKPKGAFYIGSQFFDGVRSPFPHSDTFFQAIAKVWELLWGQEAWQGVIQEYLAAKSEQEAPFVCTSIFPCVAEVYFFPYCLGLDFAKVKENMGIEEIAWVSMEVYRSGKASENGKLIAPAIYCHEEDAQKLPPLEDAPLWSHQQRIRNHTALAQTHPGYQVYSHRELEIFAVFQVRDDYRERLEGALRLLADEGIGGKRSIGCGGFAFDSLQSLPSSLSFLQEKVEDEFATLSLYHPQWQDVEKGILDNSHYQIIKRRGWQRLADGTSVSKQQVGMLREGSYFKYSSPLDMQYLLDVTDDQERDVSFFHYVYPFRVAIQGGGK